jgi:bis(5'-nucleosidyl)-tetraphosphatase
VARWFIAENKVKDLILPINPAIGKAEHNEYRWLSYEEAGRVVGARIQAVLDWAKQTIGDGHGG